MRFSLNGRDVDVEILSLKRLLDVLRDECGLTGTKEGCGEGECGACTVLLDGEAVCSCLVPIAQVAGHEVTTIEGIDESHPLKRAFAEEGAAQCGICSPGMILTAAALDPAASPEAIKAGLAGTLCRCTGYEAIYRAISKGEIPMRTAISKLELLEPRSLEEALTLLRDEGPLTPLAGGTDLYVDFNFGTSRDRRFIDLSGLTELHGIVVRGDSLRLGALTTYTELIRSDEVNACLPILAAAAREVGGVQIQNRGTLGGNVANGSPAGDTLPVLAVAEAVVVLASEAGERRVPFNGFYTGYRKTVKRPDELILAFEVPPVQGTQWFRKVGTRQAQAISKVVMAAVRSPRPRLALGSVAPTVVRLPNTEAALAAGASIGQAEQDLLAEIQPIDDIRSTAAYRRQVAANLLRRFWSDTV